MSDWRQYASCIGIDDEVFFPTGGYPSMYDQARSICASCFVLDECRDHALRVETGTDFGRYGMFGGLTPVQRASLAGFGRPVARVA